MGATLASAAASVHKGIEQGHAYRVFGDGFGVPLNAKAKGAGAVNGQRFDQSIRGRGLNGHAVAHPVNTLQVQLGSLYINNFNLYNQVYQVQAQAEGWGRSNPQDVGRLFVRNSDNDMIPVSTIALQMPMNSCR